ncbi:hypothetical protein B0J11DRAFT_89206 [Dendryphion nanum]|uniref:Uncharacterized protein n=1 Tax=Dendryphion nanum TaxID=256645 RepID=A0A9P9IDH6_9PLEO|nr:hypothetical protein B0J11DRAFT_89206 [Dendryphion nanum]
MGEHKVKTSSKSKTNPYPISQPKKMATSSSKKSNLTSLLQNASSNTATFVRCPTATLQRLRHLHEAEWITLFTPVVPHPPATILARNMDPFEPLGRALPRQVRHVPYRMDNGMTETHADFLPPAGAIIIVMCTTENVMSHNSYAFHQQVEFARAIQKKANESRNSAHVPLILVLVTDNQTHEPAVSDFPALVTNTEYTTQALANAVQVLFGS